MPTLIQSLHLRDIGHLRIVAGLWGVELAPADQDATLEQLARGILDPVTVREMIESLPGQVEAALQELAHAGGRIPWSAFTRSHGEIRESGPGRRDREQEYLHPVSSAEFLFFRAFIARGFFDTNQGLQEYTYIPHDLLALIHPILEARNRPDKADQASGRQDGQLHAHIEKDIHLLGRLATPREYAVIVPATDCILDHATTFLAAERMGIQPPEMPIPAKMIAEFLSAAGIIIGEAPIPEEVKQFLESARQQALAGLRTAWKQSDTFNELRLLPTTECSGEWSNDPLATRSFLLGKLEELPSGKWWHLPSFIHDLKEASPDFQRPAGDYDAWYIKRISDGTFLRGFSNWDEVEGALITFLISGPLFWLGLVDLAKPKEDEPVIAFRMNEIKATQAENGKISVGSNGRISAARLVPRLARYFIARFCEWEEGRPDEYRYRVTTLSLKKARQQGLKTGQLLSLLARNSASEIPPVFIKALKRWEQFGTEARIETQTLLRVSHPEVIETLRKTKAGRFLLESLGPETVIIKPGAQSRVIAALAEMGLLSEVLVENTSSHIS